MGKINFEGNADKISKLLGSSLLKGVTESCLIVEAAAKALAPVGKYPKGSGKTGGTLRSKIDNIIKQNGDMIQAAVGTDVDYGIHVEFGTMHQKAQPYLRPSFRVNKAEIEKRIGQEVKDGVGG